MSAFFGTLLIAGADIGDISDTPQPQAPPQAYDISVATCVQCCSLPHACGGAQATGVQRCK